MSQGTGDGKATGEHAQVWESRTFWTSVAGLATSAAGAVAAGAALLSEPKHRAFCLAIAAFFVSAAAVASNIGSILAKKTAIAASAAVEVKADTALDAAATVNQRVAEVEQQTGTGTGQP